MIDWLRQGALPETVEICGKPVPLSIRRLARARRLTMRLAPDGSEVRITMPRWGRTLDALAFVQARQDWLERQLGAIPRAAPPLPGGTIFHRGEPLLIDWSEHHPRAPRLGKGSIRLGGAGDALPTRLRRWLEAEALRLFADDLAHYCARAALPLPELRLSRAQRRWGSCSNGRGGAGSIRINWRLVQAPDPVRRSVVAHEVAHLVHFDHSPAFHAFLKQLYDGDLAAADAWLRKEGRSLYTAFG